MFAVLIATSVVIELRSRSPPIDLESLRRRTLSGANLIGLILGSSLFGVFFLLTLYQQNVLGYSPLKSGLARLAIALPDGSSRDTA